MCNPERTGDSFALETVINSFSHNSTEERIKAN